MSKGKEVDRDEWFLPEDKDKYEKYLRGADDDEPAEAKTFQLQRELANHHDDVIKAARGAVRSEMLQTTEAGYIEEQMTQKEITKEIPIAVASRKFDFQLPNGPYRADITLNGRSILLGGQGGHVASFDWYKGTKYFEIYPNDEVRDVINGRVQDKRVIIELQDVFYVQYLSLDSLRSGKVQYYDKHIMDYNQKHNYRPSITLSNRQPAYPDGFAAGQIEELTRQLAVADGADARLLRGVFYLSEKDFPEAIEDFSAILAGDPDNLLALFNLANARVMMYDYIESAGDLTSRVVGEQAEETRKVDYSLALEGYRRCLQLDPDFVFARFNIGNVHAKNGEIDRAIEAYTQAIQEDKELAEAYFNRGLLFIYTGQKAQANADLSKAGELGIISAYNIIKRYCR